MEIVKIQNKITQKEAVQYFDNKFGSDDPFWKWMTADCDFQDPDGVVSSLEIKTLEGPHLVSDGDWIVKGVAGEFYPVKPAIFEKSYEIIKQPGDGGATAMDAIY